MTGLAVLVGWMGVFAPLPGWKLVAVAPGGGTFFYPRLVVPDGSFVGRGPSPFSTLWYRATDQRLVVWDRGWIDNWQRDCGLGYVSFNVGEDYETYDLATGELILRVPGPAYRIGLSIVGSKTWDLHSGREVPAIPKTRLVWDSPRRRLGIQETERGYRVVEYEPGTTREMRSARHRWGLVDHVWGDPDTGPFALQATASNGMPMYVHVRPAERLDGRVADRELGPAWRHPERTQRQDQSARPTVPAGGSAQGRGALGAGRPEREADPVGWKPDLAERGIQGELP